MLNLTHPSGYIQKSCAPPPTGGLLSLDLGNFSRIQPNSRAFRLPLTSTACLRVERRVSCSLGVCQRREMQTKPWDCSISAGIGSTGAVGAGRSARRDISWSGTGQVGHRPGAARCSVARDGGEA